MAYILFHSLALLGLGALVWLPGNALHRRLVRSTDPDPLRPLAAFTFGAALWIALTFTLAAGGFLHRAAVGVAAGLFLVFGLATWLRCGAPRPSLPARPRAQALAAAAALTTVLVPLLLLALSPQIAWDADVYHLTLPRRFIDAGGFVPAPFLVYAHWPLNTELLFAVAMLAGDYVLAKLVHLGFGLLVFAALMRGCRAFHQPASGWLAIALVLANPVVIFEMRAAYVDLAYTFFFLVAFFAVHRALEHREEAKGDLLVAGVACGLIAGIKVTGLAAAVVIGTLAVIGTLPRPPFRRLALRFALPTLLLAMPWMLKAAWETGDPFYPLLHRWLGGPGWSAALTAQFQAWQQGIGMGREPIDYLLLPLRVILRGGPGYDHFDGRLTPLWIVFLPLALLGMRLPLVRRALGCAGLYFLLWSLSSQQMRFLIPILPLLALAAAVSCVERLRALAPRRRQALGWVALAATLAFLLTTHAQVLGAGLKSGRIYLLASGGEALRQSVVPPVFAHIDDTLPAAAKLLFLNTNRGFHCQRDYVADSFFEASQIADWLRPAEDLTALRARLDDMGITHILIERRQWGIAYPEPLLELLGDSRQAVPHFRSPDGRHILLALQPTP